MPPAIGVTGEAPMAGPGDEPGDDAGGPHFDAEAFAAWVGGSRSAAAGEGVGTGVAIAAIVGALASIRGSPGWAGVAAAVA
jgi:hypothetical protein